jgi:hypothetical protein
VLGRGGLLTARAKRTPGPFWMGLRREQFHYNAGFEHRTAQLVASCYTDYAIMYGKNNIKVDLKKNMIGAYGLESLIST